MYENQFHTAPPGFTTETLKEFHLYGSSRLGLLRPERLLYHSSGDPDLLYTTSTRQEKTYELSNHLGNILTAISDKKLGEDIDSDPEVDRYVPLILSQADYFPFGLEMPERTISADSYRFGFNGKEKDDAISSLTNYDYGFRIYNPGLGRFLSVDPLTASYPMLTPYQFASNNVIAGLDLDGLEFLDYPSLFVYFGDPRIELVAFDDVVIADASVYNKATYGGQFDIPNPSSREYLLPADKKHIENRVISKSTPKQQRQELQEKKDASITLRNSMRRGASVGGGAMEFARLVDGLLKVAHRTIYSDEIDIAVSSARATVEAVKIVNSAIDNGILPPEISHDLSITRGIVNYLIDGSLRGDDPKPIHAIGDALFKYKDSVIDGTFSLTKKYEIVCIGCENSSNELRIPVEIESDDPVIVKAREAIQNLSKSNNNVQHNRRLFKSQ